MQHIKPLLIRFTITTIALFIFLAIFQWVNILNILLIGLLITGLSYIIGDLFILPRFGNIITSIVNFDLIFLTIWLLSSFYIQTAYSVFITSFFIAFLIVCSEAILDIYMLEKFVNPMPVKKEQYKILLSKPINRFQTEFSEEMDELDSENKNVEKNSEET